MTIEKLQKFANDHGLVLNLEGEVGIGRECVGFTHGNSYVDYNPITMGGDYDPVPGFEDERIAKAAPEDAYHKHQCLAVLVQTDREKAIEQLGEWVDAMNEIGVEMVDYRTGATGMQTLMTPPIGRAVRPKR
jgi:hypothetical protein